MAVVTVPALLRRPSRNFVPKPAIIFASRLDSSASANAFGRVVASRENWRFGISIKESACVR